MTKYKKAKPAPANSTKTSLHAPVLNATAEEVAAQSTSPKKRLPPGSITLQFAGELVLAKLGVRELAQPFHRFSVLFESLANMERSQRLLNYKLLNALMLTSHGRKTPDRDKRRAIFDLKNQLFFDIANNSDTRRKIALRYLTTKRARVINYCETCTKTNTEGQVSKYTWRYCDNCDLDRSYFNVLAMTHRFPHGQATIFLSQELIGQVQSYTPVPKGKLDEVTEEAVFQGFHYGIQNLDAILLESVVNMNAKLLGKQQ